MKYRKESLYAKHVPLNHVTLTKKNITEISVGKNNDGAVTKIIMTNTDE